LREFFRAALMLPYYLLWKDTWKSKSRFIHAEDGLISFHNSDFRADLLFRQAYARGLLAAGKDYHWQWRLYIGLWAAHHAKHLTGDFVECGVSYGFLSS